MAWEAVDNIGQGRVWSGTNAKEIGLVDEFGGLTAAIDLAKEKANIGDHYRIVELPEQADPIEELIKELTGETTNTAVKKHLGENYRYYKNISKLVKINGIQARLPFEIDIY